MADLFKLQDQVVARITNSLRVELANAESHRPRLKSPDSVDLTMRGWALLWNHQDPVNNQRARNVFERAVELDPENSDAYAGIAYTYTRDFANGWSAQGVDYAVLVIGPADRSLAIDPANGMAAYAKGLFLTLTGRFAEAKIIVETALQRNPNLAPIYAALGILDTAEGAYEKAKSDVEQATRLSPRDAQLGLWEFIYGRADLGLGRYAEAIDEEHRAINDNFRTYWPHEVLAAAYALSDHEKAASAELGEAIHLNPRITSIKSLTPLDSQISPLVDGLRKAGLPEE